MRKPLLLLVAFLVLSVIMAYCPVVTYWDSRTVLAIQEVFNKFPRWIPLLPDCKLYSIMIALPLVIGTFVFCKSRNYKAIVMLCSVPLITFLLNCIIKPLVHRTRPAIELQQLIHPNSYSYVSSHSLVTICLYGMIIYFLAKYCTKKILKYSVIIISVFWILFVGLSRIWLGVHYPSDVLGAYLLGLCLIFIYIKIFNLEFKE